MYVGPLNSLPDSSSPVRLRVEPKSMKQGSDSIQFSLYSAARHRGTAASEGRFHSHTPLEPSSTASPPISATFFTLALDFRSNPCNNYSVLPDGFGGVSVWRKFDCKRVNPSRTLCAVSSAKFSRKTSSKR